MNLATRYSLIFFFTFILFIGCSQSPKEEKIIFRSLAEVPVEKWQALATKRIYFGHQSVGYNILDGINDLVNENPQIKLNVVESTDFSKHLGGAFFHSKVGANFDPGSKMGDFEKAFTADNAGKIDIAFLKFCYVDITADTKPEQVFASYADMLKRVRANNPQMILVHFTAPLTANQGGWKAYLKNLIGRPIGGQDDNIKRYEYSQMITSAFEKTEPVLDIARLESTKRDGIRASFKKKGKDYFYLNPEYTYDGGHLNEVGRKLVAEQLLLLLASRI